MNTHHHTPWRVYSTHAIFESDASRVWPLLADFNGLPRLLPEIVTFSSTEGSGVGAVRTLVFGDGTTAKETLIALHPEVFRQAYSMQDPAPCPWKHYFCTQQLQPLGGGQTHLLVSGYCHPAEGKYDEVRGLLRGVYHGLFAGISRELDIKVSIQPE